MDKHVISYIHKPVCLFNHSAPAIKPITGEHFQGSYSSILFPWVYFIVFRNNTEDRLYIMDLIQTMKVEELAYFHAHSSKLVHLFNRCNSNFLRLKRIKVDFVEGKINAFGCEVKILISSQIFFLRTRLYARILR